MSSRSSGDFQDISAILAKACAEHGVTAGQISALAGTLSRLRVDPGRADWEHAARLLREKDDPQAESATPRPQPESAPPQWNDDFKLKRDIAKGVLADAVPGLCLLFEKPVARDLRKLAKNIARDDMIAADGMLDLLGAVEIDPALDEEFHLLGAAYHALASLAHRRAMSMLAYHIRILAAYPGMPQERAAALLDTAQHWETMAVWTRRRTFAWSDDPAIVTCDRWEDADKFLRAVHGKLAMIARLPQYATSFRPHDKASVATQAGSSAAVETASSSSTVRLLDKIGGVPDTDDDTSVYIKTKPWRMLMEPLPIVGKFDPDETYRVLRREFPWMEDANRGVAEMIAGLRIGRPRLAPILLTGEPGIGKTAWAIRLAELCELPFTTVSVSTSASSMLISGDEREWSSSAPCLAARVARDKAVANPMIILDELEKAPAAASSHAASVHEALLPILDCDEKRTYYDLFLQGQLNLSRFSWVFLSNGLTGLPAPLLDRLTVLQARRPTVAEIDLRLDDMAQIWAPGQAIDPENRRLALARFEETRSLRDVRKAIERVTLQGLWQAPGPRAVTGSQEG